jgi:NarL family two-component system response regulator LiaR
MDTLDAPAPVTVIIADDDPLARRIIKHALREASITVVAEATNGREAVELAVHYRPDVVLMDLVMPELGGMEAARQLHQLVPEVRIIMLTVTLDDDVGLACLRAGAVGFLNKGIDLKALGRAIRGVASGEAAISRVLANAVIEQLRRGREGTTRMRPVRSPLTDREWQVLDLLSEGLGTEAIAEDLVLTTDTVRSHVKNILRKLGVSSRADAIAAASQLRDAGDDLAGELVA